MGMIMTGVRVIPVIMPMGMVMVIVVIFLVFTVFDMKDHSA